MLDENKLNDGKNRPKNKTDHHSLVEGDGTQTKSSKTADANWFGKSKEPQEEFVKGEADERIGDTTNSNHESPTGPTSEGKPTL